MALRRIETLIISGAGNCKGSASVCHQAKLTLKVIAVALMIRVTIVVEFALDKAMAKYEDMDGIASLLELPSNLNGQYRYALHPLGDHVEIVELNIGCGEGTIKCPWFDCRIQQFSFKCPHRPVSAPWQPLLKALLIDNGQAGCLINWATFGHTHGRSLVGPF
ncbi:hypothetical protein VNO77_33883 [Canavalia gladiata]|uniref:Uncharacterized protein n=1 Tax=Canavalia gladiata TaxID=3824 RepID=A0AAN9KDB9_CANGL